MARKAVERNIAYDDQRKLYYVSMELGRDESGKRLKRYRTFHTLAAARNGLRDFHAGLERERELERKLAPAQELDLSHWLEYWMDSIVRPNRAETTVYAYQKIIDNHIDPALGTVPLKRLTPKMVQEYYTETQRTSGLSSNTMRRHHDLLSSALRSAVRQDVIPASPMERVEPPKVRTTESYFYNNQELKLLYQKIEGNILELAVKLAGSLGMRREEICGLKWENVDLRRHLVLIREARSAYGANIVQKETKNRASVRTLYLPDEVYLILERERARQQQERCLQSPAYNPTDHVILDAKGAPYSPNALSLAFTRFVRKNDLPRLTFHGLRHTFATIASCQGASLFDIGKALGHATPATTGRIYTHLVDRTHEELVQRVSDALK